MQEFAFGVKTRTKSTLRSCKMINTTLQVWLIPNWIKLKILKFEGQISQTLQVFETDSQGGESLIWKFRLSILKRFQFIFNFALALNEGICFWSLN